MAKTRIIIIGGGFGGVKCAQTLCQRLSVEEAEVVLFDRQNHLVFSPLLAEVVGSSLNPLDVVVPLRHLLPRAFCRTEEVRSLDFANKTIGFSGEDGQPASMTYDHLVIACGSATNLNAVPGMADHAFPLKTVLDAARLRAHVIEQMELAEISTDPARRKWRLTVLVVGGGYSGVEAAGEINDLLRSSARHFRHWTAAEARVILFHSREQILPEISVGLRDFARKKMEKAGVGFILNARVSSATLEGVGLQDGRFIKGATVVCTVGSSAAPIICGLTAPKQKERLLTEPDLRLKDQPNVWAIGDCAWVINAHDGQPAPTTGQLAEREGRQCAENIARLLRATQPSSSPAPQAVTRTFSFKPLGELCSIGGHSAVADLFGLHLSGFLAWFVWRGVYLFKLPTIGRRLQVGFDWATLLIFPRDLAFVRPEQTERVSHAHYDAGDFIFRQGDAPTNFYVVEKGEVEIIRKPDGGFEEIVTVLGAGAFFGERALIGNRPRVMSARARVATEVLVMGKNVFTQMSATLAPLRDALAQTLNRRSVEPWKTRPQTYELLKKTPIQTVMEPVPQPFLKPTATFRETGQAFVEHGNEFFYVSSDDQTLEGVVTITDLIRGRAAQGDSATVADFMTPNPVIITAQDNCATAANTIAEYRLKTLPVVETAASRKLIGCVRVRRLMAFVLKEGGETSGPQRYPSAGARS